MTAMMIEAGRLDLRAPIDMLPDNVLLELFDHHRLNSELYFFAFGPWEWHRLAHVCRQWRTVIFNSPHRLKLQLVYTYNKPARKNLDCWPDLPLSIRYPASRQYPGLSHIDEENFIVALEHPDRICEIDLDLTRPLIEKLAPLMQDPFPMLETLRLVSHDWFVIPSTFLGGSAPRLRSIYLSHTPFPSLPQFLSTAPALVSFRLLAWPTQGYLSPGALVTGLEAKPDLEILHIDWNISGPGQQGSRTPYPQTRAALPALTEFRFRGDNEYLEDLIARIDAPKIEQFFVTLFGHESFDFLRLAEFISRTEHLTSPHRMSIRLWGHCFSITHYFALPFTSRTFSLQISCDESTGQMKPLIQACGQLSLLLSHVERLDIEANGVLSDWRDKPDTVRWLEWLELFSLFGTVQMLELIGDLVPFAASALEQSNSMGYGAVLPFLRDLHLRCLDSSAPQMDSFLAFRQGSGRVVSIHQTIEKREFPSFP
jgi:hypothetical protein